MFQWYQNAARCYVYLSDVSKPDNGVDDQYQPQLCPGQVFAIRNRKARVLYLIAVFFLAQLIAFNAF